MKKKILWITETAVMLALLVGMQAVTKAMSQFVTGSCVNAVLAVTVLVAGLSSGLTVATISPVMAYLLGIAPNLIVMPAIALGNIVFVLVMYFVAGKDSKKLARQIAAWAGAAAAKFAVLYFTVTWLICNVLAQSLIKSGFLKPPMLKALPATFSWPQLITALIGGGVALLIVPALRKALRK